jgi:hypothetical protein
MLSITEPISGDLASPVEEPMMLRDVKKFQVVLVLSKARFAIVHGFQYTREDGMSRMLGGDDCGIRWVRYLDTPRHKPDWDQLAGDEEVE